jgi:hypothetical protein
MGIWGAGPAVACGSAGTITTLRNEERHLPSTSPASPPQRSPVIVHLTHAASTICPTPRALSGGYVDKIVFTNVNSNNTTISVGIKRQVPCAFGTDRTKPGFPF